MRSRFGRVSVGVACGLMVLASARADDCPARDSNLERLWGQPEPINFQQYRQNYGMLTHTNTPNDNPTSPNPSNQGPPATHDLNQGEAKFEISFKATILSERAIGCPNSLWLGYTQQSYWQIFDAAHSRPFRESNYEPELIFSRRLGDFLPSSFWLRPAFANFGVVHQSNGQSDPHSRSWNRLYAEIALVNRSSGDASYAVLLRPWWRFPEARANDDNPDITHYLGYGDVEFLYWTGHHLISVLARKRSVQLDLSRPFVFGERWRRSLQLHLQLFTGYGESLIDYNQRHTTIGVGLSLPYGTR